MKSLEENYAKFTDLNAIALGIGVDSVPCNKAWGKSIGVIRTALVSDFWPHGEVAKVYGVFRDKDGFSERANIIIEENQTVVFAKIYPIDHLPEINEIMGVLSR
jgi:peroxiredoxin